MSVLGPQAVVHGVGEGQANHAFMTRHFRLLPEDTGGTFALWEEEIPEGIGPPLHIHHDAQELFVVLEGRVRFRCSGREAEVGPGGTVLIPQHAEHTFRGLGPGTARVLVQLVPGHGAGFFRAVEGLSPETDMDRIIEIGREYDLEFVGPPI
jgi:mannose-6-phosphate isomerase-like protein (cupin superfamily)